MAVDDNDSKKWCMLKMLIIKFDAFNNEQDQN